MRFRRGEVVLYRLKMKCQTANVAKVNVIKVGGISSHFCLTPKDPSDQRKFRVPSPQGDFEIVGRVAIFKILREGCVW